MPQCSMWLDIHDENYIVLNKKSVGAPLENAVLIELTQPLIFIVPTKICLHLAQNLSMPRHYLLTKSKRPKCSENKDILIKVTFYFRNGYIISSTLGTMKILNKEAAR